MSYLVIARKWRPQTFEDVVGQPHVTRTLQNAIRLERIAHAYLFTGARGVGKTSIARILAKSLNCEKGPAPIPCNECSNCREIAQGNSVDVLEIDGASNRGIDNIRELRETVRYRPAKGRFKVYIIDEVHMLTAEAFNALLKTLEEPPPHVVFIFATTEPHKIPATILSRCQRFDFRRMVLSALVEHLRRIIEGEGAQFSDLVLYSIAREADGSMRDAQSLLEQLLAFSGDGLPDEEILDILGVIDRRSVLRAGEAVISGNAGECLDLVEDLYRRGIDTRRFCQHLCDHFRNLLFLTLGDARETRLDLPEEERKFLKEQAARTSRDSLHVYFQMLLRGEEEIRRSSMPKIALEMLLLRMAQLPRLESLDAVLDRISELETTLRRGFPDGAPALPHSPGPPSKAAKNPPLPAHTPTPASSRQRGPQGAGAPTSETGGPPAAVASMPPATVSETVAAPARIQETPSQPGSAADASASPSGDRPRPPARNEEEHPPDAPLPDAAFFPPEARSALTEEPSETVPEKPSPSASPSTSPQDVVDRWAGFMGFLEGHDPMLWAKVAHCGVRVIPENKLELEVPELFEKSANGPEFLRKLGAASDAFFGATFEWVIIKKEQAAKGASAQNAKAPQSSGRQIVNHPAVQQAIEILGAELVEVKPARESGRVGVRSGKKTGQGR
ncbi:MAG: DNA polymerase III subunit gamma/tau [Syntrophobacter sp.]